MYIAVTDSPHLELSLLDQEGKLVVVFAAQGWDTPCRRDAHILSALGSSLQRDKWGTRASSRVGGQIWPRSPAFLFHFVNTSINLKNRLNQSKIIWSLSTITWEKCNQLTVICTVITRYFILYTLYYVLPRLKYTWISISSPYTLCTIDSSYYNTEGGLLFWRGTYSSVTPPSSSLMTFQKWLVTLCSDTNPLSIIHVLAEEECGTFRLVTCVQDTPWMYGKGQRPKYLPVTRVQGILGGSSSHPCVHFLKLKVAGFLTYVSLCTVYA